MENVTNYTQYAEYKVSVVMWKVLPPFIIVLGTFGNLATIFVMSRIKDNNSSQYVILIVLAMADLCVLYSGLLTSWLMYAFDVFVPGFHTVLCKLYQWVLYSSNTTSAWLVVTVTVQRTMAVLWPHRMRMMCTVRRTRVVIAVVVATAFSVQLPVLIELQLNEKNKCKASGYFDFFFIWQWVDSCISSVLPSIGLLICSVILSRTLFRSASLSSTAIRATSNVNTDQSQSGRKSGAVKVTVMILALSCTFLILTLPVCINNILEDNINTLTPKSKALSSFFDTLVNLMWYSNSAVNFLLYCITGARFRKEFLSLFLCGAKSQPAGETTAITSSGGKIRSCGQQLGERHNGQATSRHSDNSDRKSTVWSATSGGIREG